MRRRMAWFSPGWGRRCKHLGKTALLTFLALMLAVGPVWPVSAAAETAQQGFASGGLLAAVGQAFEAAMKFTWREQVAGRPIPEQDLSAALGSLNEFSLAVLRDPRLAEIIDQVISDLVTNEELPGGIQKNKEFIAEIIRDPRLEQVLGEIIADYLQDERLARDIEDFFNIIFDLITREDLHYFIRDSLAALVEHKSLEKTINELLLAATGMIYSAGSDAVAALLADERVPLVISELISIVAGSVPETVSLLLVEDNNRRILGVAEDILLILAQYGGEVTLDILEDIRLRESLADMLLLVVDPHLYLAVASMGTGLAEHLLEKTAEGLTADETLENALGNLIHDFFKAGAQDYFLDSLTELIKQARSRAQEATPEDRRVVVRVGFATIADEPALVQKSIADALAKVPPQIAKYAVFMWLVDGNPSPPYSQTPGLDPVPRTYRQWGRDLGGLLKQNNRAGELAAALSADLRNIVYGFIEENGSHISDSLRAAIVELPLEEAAAEIRRGGRAAELLRELVGRIIGCLPLEELAQCILEEADIAGVIEELSEDFVSELPFDRASRLLLEDRRLIEALEGSLPHVTLAEVAETIRRDERIIAVLADAAKNLPVDRIIDFIQDERRAALIGGAIARTLLNLAADFVADEELAVFLHGVLIEAINSLEGTPGILVTDVLSRFLENENFAGNLVNSLYEFTYGVKTELWQIYREIVPRFFTHALWRFI